MNSHLLNKDLLKRLELIKDLVSLSELDIVRIQIEKLSVFEMDDKLSDIIHELRNNEYADAVKLIDQYIGSNRAVTMYEDPELSGTRLQLAALELELARVQSQKVEMERQIFRFNTMYQKELGSYILKLLELKKTARTRKSYQQTEMEDKAAAEREYAEYKNIYDACVSEQIPFLNVDQAADLRQTFIRASKLCHPDVVADEFKIQAEQTFIELKRAFERNDIERVKEIFFILEKGKMSIKSVTIQDIDKLKAMIVLLKTKIKALDDEIADLKESQSWRILQGINDMELYIIKMKNSLIYEINIYSA